MSLGTSNRDGGRTSESGHLRPLLKAFKAQVLTGLQVSQRGAGANMSVDIAIGDAIIPRSDGTYGHPAWNDATYNQVISAADVSNPRRDIIVMYIDYAVTPSTGVSNNTNGVVKIKVVNGTPAGSPADPSDSAIQASVGASNPFVKLARVRVAAAASSITNSVIDDMRTMAQALENGGWNALSAAWDAWAYSSWDSTRKYGVITVADSSIFTLGQKVKFWQLTGGWKYGFIMAKPNGTSIGVYFGSQYSLANERIYLPSFSRDSAPDGFNRDPSIWTESWSTNAQLNMGVVGTSIVNVTGANVPTCPGQWDLEFAAYGQMTHTGASYLNHMLGISSANNSWSDKELKASGPVQNASLSQTDSFMQRKKTVVTTVNTTWYLNTSALNAATTQYVNGLTNYPAFLKATCGYLNA